MNREQIQELFRMGEKRDEARLSMLRYLLMLAAGALTLLVSLRTGTPHSSLALWCLRVAWVALGLGILLGGIALHREVWTATALPGQWLKQIKSGVDAQKPVVVDPPRVYRCAERGSYVLLSIAVLALVAHGLFDSPGLGRGFREQGSEETYPRADQCCHDGDANGHGDCACRDSAQSKEADERHVEKEGHARRKGSREYDPSGDHGDQLQPLAQ
jgi:hypothetical protein